MEQLDILTPQDIPAPYRRKGQGRGKSKGATLFRDADAPVKISGTVDASVFRRLEGLAAANRCSFSSAVRVVLADYFAAAEAVGASVPCLAEAVRRPAAAKPAPRRVPFWRRLFARRG